MVASPDGSRIIVAGFHDPAQRRSPPTAWASLDATTGATLPWAATNRIQSAGANGAISSLSTDGVQVYGTGYAFGAGASFEGTFAADPYTGNINWVNDCLGDTYRQLPAGPGALLGRPPPRLLGGRRLPRHQPSLALAEGGRRADVPGRHDHQEGRVRLGLTPACPTRDSCSGIPT